MSDNSKNQDSHYWNASSDSNQGGNDTSDQSKASSKGENRMNFGADEWDAPYSEGEDYYAHPDYDEEYDQEEYWEDDDRERRFFRFPWRGRRPEEDMIVYDPFFDGGEEGELEARDYRPVRFSRRGRVGIVGGIMYFLFVISVSVVLACAAWMAASDVLALNKPEHEAVVLIPKDYEMEDVIDQLKDAGLIEYKFLFRLYSKISSADEKITAGEFNLSTKLDYRALVTKMQAGSEAQQRTTLVFPEGFTMEQVFQRLVENDICGYEDLVEAAANYNYTYSFLEEAGTGDSRRLEGFLFPDTYEFYQGEQASSVINKFLLNFHNRLTKEAREQIEATGYTIKQIVTLASLIEREAANDEERPVISSVIYNRLNIDMPLQIDATIVYFLDEHKAYITEADTQIDNPYNTYKYPGIPPGPIANPGLSSIQAAIHPNSTNNLYYALDLETNTHRFFTNSDEHAAFVSTQDYASQQ